MASRELSILLKAKGALQASRDIGKVNSAVGNLGRTAARGVRTAVGNIGRLGVVAGGVVAFAVKGGIQSLAELETAVTSVDGAVEALGLTGQVSGAQVAGWANEIETAVGRAFDDKEITAAATTLLRFGKVTPANLKPALVVMTDLATKTGSVDGAASLLAKALADPTKAAGKLARVGIVLTKAEQKKIAALMKAGKVGKAQALILDALTKSTKGAALASQGPYARALATLADVSEDAKRALAEGFLPVIERAADFLSNELAKPETIGRIREFGQHLAGAFDKAIEFAKNIPWGTIGDSLKVAGAGAKMLFDAFTMLPPWVQTAVVTGWGLNKLTGGAVGSIVGQLASGLIKGVLGINAGVVNINAASVGGAAGAAGKGGIGIMGFLGIATVGIIVAEALSQLLPKESKDVHTQVTSALGIKTAIQKDPEGNAIAMRTWDSIKSGNAAIVNAIHGIRLNITVPVTVKAGFTRRLSTSTGTTIVRIGGNAAAGALAGA